MAGDRNYLRRLTAGLSRTGRALAGSRRRVGLLSAVTVAAAVAPNVLRRLWDAFALTDEQLAGMLGGRVHPAAGQWLASWDEPPQ